MMGSTLTNLIYHVVFSTKGREPVLDSGMRYELCRYIGGIVRAENGILIEVGGMADHLHIRMKLRPIHKLSDIMQKIKGSSSKWINEQNRLQLNFRWQDGYGAFTVSESQVPVVANYIQNQERHHQGFSYQSEFELLLERHNVEFDAKYVWS